MSMNEGATQVGSIKAILTLDKSDYVEGLRAAGLQAKELEKDSPTIRVDADTASAVAQLAAVGAAADKVGLQQSRSIEVVTRAQVGQARAQRAVADAEAALSRARADSTSTSERISLLERRLTDARDNLSLASMRLSNAQNTAAVSAQRLADANDNVGRKSRTAHEGVGPLLSAIVLLGPAIAPLAAATVGLGSAFIGMGAAGILAYKGIGDEMAKGTSMGRAYSTGVHLIQSDLDSLKQVAAGGILSPFQATVRNIHDAMPALHSDVAKFSAMLGNAAAPAVNGMIIGWRTLQPLLDASGLALVRGGQALERFAASQGFASFVSYATAALPQVISFLTETGSAVGHIVAAFAPFGGTVLSTIQLLASAINAMPIGLLQTLATLGEGVFVGFKSWSMISALVSGVGKALEGMGKQAAAASLASSSVSMAVGGVAAVLGIAAMAWTAHQQAVIENQQAVNDLTQALVQSGGVIDDTARKVMAKKLSDDGVLESARKMHLDLSLVTDAMLGQGDAAKQLSDQLGRIPGGPMGGFRKEIAVLNLALQENGVNTADAVDKYHDLAAAQKTATAATDPATAALELQAATYGTTVASLKQAASAQAAHTDQAAAATLQMQLESNAAGLLRAEFDKLSGKSLSAAQASTAFDGAMLGLAGTMDRATGSVAGHDEASVNLQRSLQGAVAAAQAAAGAVGDEAGSSEVGRQKAIELREAIVEQAVAHGANAEEVRKYIEKLWAIPSSVPPTKIQADTAAAEAAMRELTRNRTATVYAQYVGMGGRVSDGSGGLVNPGLFVNANGNILNGAGSPVHAFAGGGFENHTAQIAPAGAMRLWAEPETGGEAYIPLAMSKRSRSSQILSTVADQFGFQIAPKGGSSPAAPVQQTFHIAQTDPYVVASELARMQALARA